jgi:photosystem II stability/assembly factor-like uncharacterized protein
VTAWGQGGAARLGSGQLKPDRVKAVRPESEPYVWRNVEIVGGGFISGIVFSPKQPNLIYARTDIGGAYRWNPSARRWMPLTDWVGQPESNLLGIESLAPDPSDARRVYAAAGTYTQSWAGNGAILRSSDQGRTWQRTDMPFKMGGNEDGRSIGERLAVDPNKNSILYYGSRKAGLWRSTDAAVTWTKVEGLPVADAEVGFVVFDAGSGAAGQPTPTLYVAIEGHGSAPLYRSTDAGATWSPIAGQPQGFWPHHGVFASNGTLYVTYGNGPGPNGMSDGAVWKYDTRQSIWTDITPVKPGSEGAGRFGYAGLAVDAEHPGVVMVSSMDKWSSGDDIFRSTDGGSHWIALKPKSVRDSSASPFVNFGADHASLGWWIGALAIDPFHPGHVLYGTGATLWGSDDVTAADHDAPTHWTVRAQGLEETAVLDLISPPTGAHLISALGDIGGFRHDDLTVSPRQGIWKNPTMNTTTGLDFAQSKPEIVARVGNGGRGKRGALSLDGGATWQPFSNEPEGGSGGGTIALSADGSGLLWTTGNGTAFFSLDHGATWTACDGLPRGAAPIADRINRDMAYAYDGAAGKLYLSTDRGAHFRVRTSGFPVGRGRIQVAPVREGDLWLECEHGGLYHSTDAGASFAKLPDVEEAYTLGFGKGASGENYPSVYLVAKIGGVVGVFRSDDEADTWVRINDDRHQYGWIGQVVTGDPRLYGRVYLGTNGRGILYADPAPK